MKPKHDSTIKEAKNFIYSNQPAVQRRIDVLKERGQLPKNLEITEPEDIEFLEQGLKEKVAGVIIGLKQKRQGLGYEGPFTGYHASPFEFKVGEKIIVGEDGKAYFSEEDSLYSRQNTVRWVYFVSADNKIVDEKEPEGLEGRFYSRSPLTILRKWCVEDFVESHPRAKFR